MMVQKTGDDPAVPCPTVQMFTDKEMLMLAEFIDAGIDYNVYERGTDVAKRLMDLMRQWEFNNC